ncbi:MAG: hypothetical protein AAF518_25890, partial [Spirochaetota bacterium]
MKLAISLIVALCLTASSALQARQLTVLPAYLIGSPPLTLQKKTNKLSDELAKLAAFHIKENYNVAISDFSELQNYQRSAGLNLKKHFGREDILRVCRGVDTEYVLRSELDFQANILSTEVYNCGGYLLVKKEGSMGKQVLLDYKRHIVYATNFLPPTRKISNHKLVRSLTEITLVLDLSGSFIKEILELRPTIISYLEKDTISVKLLLVGKKQSRYISSPQKIKQALQNLPLGGEVTPDQMANALYKIPGLRNKKQTKTLRQVYIFTDIPTQRGNIYAYQNSLQSLKYAGYKIRVFTNSSNPQAYLRLHANIAAISGKPLQNVIYYKTIGTNRGYRTLYLHDNRLYYDSSRYVRADSIRTATLQEISQRKIKSKVNNLHPNNIDLIYSQITGEKILERKRGKTNISYLFRKAIGENERVAQGGSRKVLLKSAGISFWIYMPQVRRDLLNQKITLYSTFYRTSSNGTGIMNVPEDTYITQNSPPKLLIYTVKEISRHLHSKKVDVLNGFIEGIVLRIK